jgi:Fe-Mn family superoxide dismutase
LTYILGGEDESKDLKHILLKHAREPSQAPLFNYASMAHNNHFFFQSLLCLPEEQDQQPEMESGLRRELEQSFGSIETLQETMVLTANAMFGPGFVWLVMGPGTQYSILCTYLAGSPYAGAHYRRQAVDMNTEDKSAADAFRRMASQPPVNSVGFFGRRSENPLLAPGGVEVTPVLCLNMWPQAYLADYGTGFDGPGPLQYAQNWWNVIDWDLVATRSDVASRSFKT